MHERGEDRHHGVHAAAGAVGHGRAGDGRLVVGRPLGAVEEAADRQVVEIVAGPLRVRPVLAEAGRRAVDDPGVVLAHGVEADAEPIDDAGAEALDDDVGARGEAQERVPAFGRLEVEEHALHLAVGAVGEEHGHDLHVAVRRHRPDFHDRRAVVGEPARRAGCGSDAGEVEHGDPFEKRAHLRSSSGARARGGR